MKQESNSQIHGVVKMPVEDLESVFEGFSNAFDEEDEIEIETSIFRLTNITIDETFNNIGFRVMLMHKFKNPL